MTPPLCTLCGGVLPDPMAHAVVTCPGCGAKSEARTRAPESERELVSDEATRKAWLAGWRAGAGLMKYVGQVTQPEAVAYDDGFTAGRIAERAAFKAGVDPIAAAHAAGVAEELARWEAEVAELRWKLEASERDAFALSKDLGRVARTLHEYRKQASLHGLREIPEIEDAPARAKPIGPR